MSGMPYTIIIKISHELPFLFNCLPGLSVFCKSLAICFASPIDLCQTFIFKLNNVLNVYTMFPLSDSITTFDCTSSICMYIYIYIYVLYVHYLLILCNVYIVQYLHYVMFALCNVYIMICLYFVMFILCNVYIM